MSFTIVMTLAMLGVLGMAVRELMIFNRQRAEYQVRRLTLRLAMAAMLFVLFASLLIGVRVFRLDEIEGVVTLALAFWGCIALLSIAVLCLAVADLRMLGDQSRQDAAQYWREIAQTIADHELRHPKE